MNYELAKKLKDAGFPQYSIECLFDPKLKEWGASDMACSPTLSELIEACGDQFYELCKTDYDWIANCYSDKNRVVYERGDSPEEAVANLWLALNKK